MVEEFKKNSRNPGKTAKVLSQMYDITSNIAESRNGTNRGIAAGTAASFIGLGLDKVTRNRSREDSNDGPPYTEEEIDHIKELASSSSEEQLKSNHFVDRLLEKLLKHVIPTDAPEKEILEKRMNDPERTKRPNLSIKILGSNFKKLSNRMSGFFELQYGLLHIVTWRKPTKTLTFLVLYTSICLWPHLVFAYPLIFLLFGILVPAYIHRHPMRWPEIIKVKKRGQSLLEFFNQSQDSSILDDFISDDYLYDSDSDSDLLRPISSRSSDDSSNAFNQHSISSLTTSSSTDSPEILHKKDKVRYVKSQMALLINMRDLQNLTTDILNAFDAAEKFWFETAGFKDEKLSTFIFYGVIIATSGVLFVGRFIPWRLIFIQTGWIGMILCHPNSKKYIVKLEALKKSHQQKEEPSNIVKPLREAKVFERQDIIIDDSPEVRVVEIYELQIKSLLKNKWSFYLYSNNLFDLKNPVRISGKRPKGVDSLSKVLPPSDWKFDIGYANKWQCDAVPRDFLHERSLDNPSFLEIRDDVHEGWIYDNMKSIDNSDIVYEFRRRRLVRECFRYSRPPRKPKRF